MQKLYALLLVTALLISLSSCGQGYDTSEEKYEFVVTITTPFGEMKAICYNETPLHKARFLELASSGRYDSTIFHRVIKDFMIQAGDLQTKPNKEDEPDRIPAEIVPQYFHKKGALAAARQGDQVNPTRESSGSQFYIIDGTVIENEKVLTVDQQKLGKGIQYLWELGQLGYLRREMDSLYRANDQEGYLSCMLGATDTVATLMGEELYKIVPPERLEAYKTVGGSPHLDDEYTVFGEVISGLDIIDKIAEVRTLQRDVPRDPVPLTMTVEKVKKKKITKDYGYTFD